MKEEFNFNREKVLGASIVKAANIETMFFTMVWMSTMLLSLFINNHDYLVFSKGVTTIVITSFFIYIMYLIFNLVKYWIIKSLVEKIHPQGIEHFLNSNLNRNLLIIVILLIQLFMYFLFFHFDLFISIKLISGAENNWLLMSVGFIVGCVVGLFKFILEIKNITNNDLTIEEIRCITDAIKTKSDDTVYFNDKKKD